MKPPKDKPLKNQVSITLDPEVIEAIKILCDIDDRNFSQYINMALRAHIEAKRAEGLLKPK